VKLVGFSLLLVLRILVKRFCLCPWLPFGLEYEELQKAASKNLSDDNIGDSITQASRIYVKFNSGAFF
jgi:hypothetical protein